MEQPGRIAFHSVIVCTGGEGLHEVDFAPVLLQPRRVVHVRPGQVHRFRFARAYEATMLVFVDEVANLTMPQWPIGPKWFDLTEQQATESHEALALLRHEQSAPRPAPVRDRATAGLLQFAIVRLGLDAQHDSDQSGLPEPYVELMQQFEDGSGWSRSVTERAARLGYSPRTLTRACKAATDRTAKEVIDYRVILEAQRLLVNRNTTVDHVSRELSFSEPSNFTKFFRRATGESPDAWRARHLAD